MKGLRGVPLSVVMACSGPSGAPFVATVPPNHCPRIVPSNTGRGSRIPGPRGPYCLIPFCLNSENVFGSASSWGLLQAFCVPSRMATVLRTTVKQGMVTDHGLQS